MANTINSFNKAIDALVAKDTLRVDTSGNLSTVKGAERFSLAFQRNVLRKNPDQLGTSQAKIASALVSLYKNENPGVSNAQVAKILDRFGFTEFAAKLKSAPDLPARQATLEKAPNLSKQATQDSKEEIFGTFNRSNAGRAGVANTTTKPAADERTHLPPDEIAQLVRNARVDVAEQEPIFQSLDEIAQAVKASKTKGPADGAPVAPPRNESLRQANPVKEQSAARLSAAASHGQQINASKQSTPQKQFKFEAPQGNDVASKLKDIQTRLAYVDQGKHFNPVRGQARDLQPGEKEQELKFLNGQLESLKAEQGKTAKTDPRVATLVADLKVINPDGNGKINARNFAQTLLPLIQDRLGNDATKQIFDNKGSYYLDLGSQARFSDIRPPKETVVSLSNGSPLHANFVPLGGLGDPAIATQAPKTENITSFLQMIEEKNVTTIIDLTNQDDRIKHKAPDYSRNPAHGFSSADRTSPELRQSNIEKRELKTANNHSVSYLNLTKWPDHGAVAIDGFKSLLSAIEQEHGSKGGGITIHCNAGVGRTGTVYAGLELSRLAKNGELNSSNFADKVLDVVAEGRKARGFAFVQAPEQLNLLFDYAKSLV
jgi:protein tyrosine phosphatase